MTARVLADSLGSNGYAKRLGLTPAQLQAVEIQQMTELWTTYGNGGNLTEICETSRCTRCGSWCGPG